ncbi:universal stress protein [Luteipulveratus sp. YIM 133132]|uniref:Universal stress protein n=1 Tax=Luteipulveratus flavus TaxID=3031728 RepID=A0ABT6CCG2_9MICO|nr:MULTISPECIES: universal stress protein [unclassified Luteipulveratus]MDE9366711.1 universal stress protein [Luteipulveratus sp. YIM 133132]MDF8265962.1 universal stress protein [Luteipulveratus sp. YIM 133296]
MSSESSLSRPLVVGYDDHPASRRALEHAVELAQRLDVPLHVVHVVDTEDMPIDPDSITWSEEVRLRGRDLADHVAGLVPLPPDRWTYRSGTGPVWPTLLEAATETGAWLVVVGQHTHAKGVSAAIGRLLTGRRATAVTDSLLRHGTLSVLVVGGPVGDDTGEESPGTDRPTG